MATTKIQIHHEQDISYDILYEIPVEKMNHAAGCTAVFNENSLVVYCISKGRRQRAFLFRTCSNGCDSIPGIYPAVILLTEASSREKVSRLLAVLKSLSHKNLDPSKLDDNFFIRLNTIIDNRIFRIRDALNLLKHKN